MRYWNNFWDNLKILWKTMNLDDVIKNQSDLLQKVDLEKNIASATDNLNEWPKMVKSAIANVGDMGKMLDNFIQFSQREKWSTIEDKIYNILHHKEKLQQKSLKQEDSSVNNDNLEEPQEISHEVSREHYLSQQDILIFCSSLLETLRNGKKPFESQEEKQKYLEIFFELKNIIAHIESVLLLREILNRTKPTEKVKENNNEDNDIFYSDDPFPAEQQREIEKLQKAIYSAFESSVKEYKDLELEIKKEYLDINKDKKISNSDASNITLDEIQKEYIEICQLIGKRQDIQMLSLIQPPNKQQNQGNAQLLEDLCNKQEKLAKLLEKAKLLKIFQTHIETQVINFIDTFHCNVEFYDQLNEFQMEKKNIPANGSCVENLKNMLTLLKGTPMLASIYELGQRYNLVTKYGSDIDNLLAVKGKNNEQEPQKTEMISVPSLQSSFLDSLCCSVCTDEPVLYSAKDINSKEDLYREPKIQKKENNNEQERINFNQSIHIGKNDNINIDSKSYEDVEGALFNYSQLNNSKSNNNISCKPLYEGISSYDMNNESSEKQKRMLSVSQYSDY